MQLLSVQSVGKNVHFVNSYLQNDKLFSMSHSNALYILVTNAFFDNSFVLFPEVASKAYLTATFLTRLFSLLEEGKEAVFYYKYRHSVITTSSRTEDFSATERFIFGFILALPTSTACLLLHIRLLVNQPNLSLSVACLCLPAPVQCQHHTFSQRKRACDQR